MSEIHDDLDCSAVLSRMFVFIDNELDSANCDQIEQHLADCGPCLEKYNLERTVKSLVKRHCGNDVAPESLRQRVRISIQEVQIQVTRTDLA